MKQPKETMKNMYQRDHKKAFENAKSKDIEPIYLAKMPTLMKGQVQSREENFEIGHTLEEGFDIVALYEETAKGH